MKHNPKNIYAISLLAFCLSLTSNCLAQNDSSFIKAKSFLIEVGINEFKESNFDYPRSFNLKAQYLLTDKIAIGFSFGKADQSITPPQIEGVPFFAGLNDEQVEKLFAIGDQVHFDKDEVILKEGSLNSNLYIILRGAARIVLANNLEESMELIEVGDGEVLGEVSLLIDAPHAATVTALEPTDVIQIERAQLMKLTEEAPELAAQVWHQLAVSLGTRLRNIDTRYLSPVRETHDVADKMLGTAPLEEPEPGSHD